MSDDVRTARDTGRTPARDAVEPSVDVTTLTRDFGWLQARTAEALLDMDARHRLIGACSSTTNPSVLEWVTARLRAYAGDRVVDLGAGLGGCSSWTAARTGADMLAIDGLEASIVGLRHLFPGIPAAVARVDALPLADASMDHAISLGLVDQLTELDGFAASAARVLRPGGRLVTVFFAADAPGAARTGLAAIPHPTTYLAALHAAGFTDVRLDALSDLPRPPEHWRRVRRRVEHVVERRHGDDLRYRAARLERTRFLALQQEGLIGLHGIVATRGE